MTPTAIFRGIAVAVLTLSFAPAVPAAYEGDALLKRAAAAMGADELKTLRYAGRGMGASFGQAYQPGSDWPKLNYSRYLRQVDYERVFTSEEVVRGRAEPRGGGAVPARGEAPFGAVANATVAWNLGGQAASLRQGALAGRLHDLWTTPHGVIKAAMTGKSRLVFRTEGGRPLAAVSFALPGIMTATAYFNEDYLLERVESRMTDAVLGDMAVVTRYSNYQSYGAVKFPTQIEQTQGGFMTLSLTIAEVMPNAPVNTAVPESVARAVPRVAAEKAAEGVWFLAGGSHNSVAIEMKDHVILVEAPLGDERTTAVFDEVRKLVPGKPVRYVVNSHPHFDHSGGLRAAVAEGATIVAQAQGKAYLDKVLANPSRITPDRMAKSGRKAKVVGFTDKMVMKDDTRTVELHPIKESDHVETFVMVYLPKEKILIQADAYTPGPPNAPVPATPSPSHLNLVENIERLKLQVERMLPLHGRMVPASELYRMVGK